MIAVAAQLPAVATDIEFPLVLNTGRIRDQWHTMTRTGKVPRLNAHSYEPYVQMHARDAQRFQLQDGGLARLSSRHGNMLARVQVSNEQRIGSVFVPMHWNDAYARSARVDALAAAITDPISGQPELKHTPVYAEPYRPAWQGFVLSRERLALPEANYCACTQGTGYWRHEIAGDVLPKNWRDWVQAALDCSGRSDRIPRCRDGPLPRRLPARWPTGSRVLHRARSALAGTRMAGQPVQSGSDRPGRPGRIADRAPAKGSVANTGRTVCACFSVGEKTIMNAIQEQKLDSVEAVGTCLKAGTGCGSCVPEIRRLVARRA